MKNILTTIPKKKYQNWEECEKALVSSDGEEGGFWLINTPRLPKESGVGAICYMVYDGMIRGYMDIVDTDLSENYRMKHRIGKRRKTHCIVMANWHPVTPVLCTGFQGWRYTFLRP